MSSLAGTYFEQEIESSVARALFLSDLSDKYFAQFLQIIVIAAAAAAVPLYLELSFFLEMLQLEDEYAAYFVESPYRRAQHYVAKELGGGGLYTLHGRQIIMVKKEQPDDASSYIYVYTDKYQRLV